MKWPQRLALSEQFRLELGNSPFKRNAIHNLGSSSRTGSLPTDGTSDVDETVSLSRPLRVIEGFFP